MSTRALTPVRVGLAICGMAVLLALPASASGGSAYTAVDLGTLGGSDSYATKVNDAGQVVGYSYIAGDVENHAFSWTKQGGMVDLGTFRQL